MLFRTPVTPVVAGGVAGRLRRRSRRADLCRALRALGRRVERGGPELRATSRTRHSGRSSRLSGLRPDVPRARERDDVRGRLCALGASRRTGGHTTPSVGRFALVGLGIALLALIRPGNAVLLAFVAFPLLVVGTWRNRLRWAGAIALAAVLPLAAWTVHNGLRFDTWALARGGNAIIPFYRAFITDHIVAPENGEASRRLAAAMQQHLLTRDPYRSYDVTLDELFRRRELPRARGPLHPLRPGLRLGLRLPRPARRGSRRACGHTPGRMRRECSEPSGTSSPRRSSAPRDRRGNAAADQRIARAWASGLPRPSEGEPIPAGQVVWISRPDQSIRQVWTSATEWHFEFDDPRDRPRFQEIERETAALFDGASRSSRERRARSPPQPALAVVPAAVDVDRRRPGRDRAQTSARAGERSSRSLSPRSASSS